MKTSLTKILGGLALTFALGTALPALAQEPGVATEGTSAPHAEEGAREPEVDEGIVNWWSFDYGEKTTDPSHKGYPPPFGWALVNFAVFLGVLSKILWQPLKAGWERRHDTIKHELDEATRLRKAAEAQLAEYTKKVSHVDDEVNALLEQLRRDAEQDRARIIEAAEHEAQRLKVEAERQIEVEIERARAELRKETVDAALNAAEQILKSRITVDDQQRLANEYVTGVEANRAAHPAGGAS